MTRTIALAALLAGCGSTTMPGNDAAITNDVGNDVGSDAAVVLPQPVEHATITARVDPCVVAPTDTYGAVTAYDRYEVDNPMWTSPNPRAVEILVPSSGAATHPVIVYGHPFGGDDWTRVRTYLEILASHDILTIFVPYPLTGETICERYDTLRGGIVAATNTFGSVMDTTRAGFIGHSFGAGATPWLAHEAITVDHWGSAGLFMYPNAPWYVFRMDAASWSDFPATTRLLLMHFADDDTNDHRIGIDEIWTPFTSGIARFRMLPSVDHGSCSMTADHIVPSTDSTRMDGVRFDALDTWGTIRYALALAACTWEHDDAACNTLDGNAGDALSLGTFADDGSAVTPMIATDDPVPAHDPGFYMFPESNMGNYVCAGP